MLSESSRTFTGSASGHSASKAAAMGSTATGVAWIRATRGRAVTD
jgi:hypothetical protein